MLRYCLRTLQRMRARGSVACNPRQRPWRILPFSASPFSSKSRRMNFTIAPLRPAFDANRMDEAFPPVGCLRRAALTRQCSQELAGEIGCVHHAFGLCFHRMGGDAFDDDLGCISRKGFPANLSRRTAVEGVGNIGPEHAQIEFVHATADLLIGIEADSNQPVLPFGFP